MREGVIEKAICEFAKANGVSTIKLSGPGDRGKPDRLLMHKGVVLFMEIKATGKKPTALQLRSLAQLAEDGFAVCWVDTVEKGIEFIVRTFLIGEI